MARYKNGAVFTTALVFYHFSFCLSIGFIKFFGIFSPVLSLITVIKLPLQEYYILPNATDNPVGTIYYINKERKMKKTIQKLISLLLCAIVLSTTLASCDTAKENIAPNTDKPSTEQSADTNTKPSDTSDAAQNNTSKEEIDNDITADTYQEQISYYMTLTETLQAELLKLKEEAYIDECEYQIKISTLEETIEMLKKTVASLSNGEKPSIDTQAPSNDNLSAKSDYKYTTENGKITITEYTGKAIDVSIPASIDGMPVVAIGEEAFKGLQIRSVIIPSGVKEIGWFAFSACTVLENITIPSSVTSIGYGAFDYCPKALKINCEKGSYIEAYAMSWGMSVVAK